MKRFTEQLQKQARSLKMSGAEKSELRSRLVAYMEYHPLPEARRAKGGFHQALPVWTAIRQTAHNFYALRAVSALVVVFLVGVPVVAEQAVPGDMLYPIKVRFNEELQGTLAQSPYEKVEWETERLERRLAEARTLAGEGKLTPEVEAEVAEAVKQHSEAAQEGIADIRANDSDEAALAEITFSSALAVQSEMLEGKETDALAGAVDAAQDTALASQQVNRPSFERLLARIEQESTSAYEFFSVIEGEASPTEKRDIERRLEAVRRSVLDATRQNDEDPEKAITLLTTALADTRKVISFMTDIDVRSSVSIDDLIPVDLGAAEEAEQVAIRIDEALNAEAEARAFALSVDQNTRIAVEARLNDAAAHLAIASSTLALGDVQTADEESRAALSIIGDVNVVLALFRQEADGAASSSLNQ